MGKQPRIGITGGPMKESGFGTEIPELSVVITSVNGYRYISQCLRSLENQSNQVRVEVIVIEASGDHTAKRIAQEYPWAMVIPILTPQPIPRLRSIGIRKAKAAVVVTTEDHCLFNEDWYERILRAHRNYHHPAIGGAVENGSREHLVDWAAYICEYGKFMLPFTSGPVCDLPGPNVSYKRDVLEKACGDLLDQGVWENIIHERLLSLGMELRTDSSIVVYHTKTFGFWEFLIQRYHFGRSYAAVRAAHAPLSTRLLFVVISPFLPPLFLWRYAKYFFGRRRFIKEFIKALPLQAIFAVIWSIGEFFGYAFGEGDSSQRVK